MTLADALPYIPSPADTAFTRRCAIYALAAVDPHCADYVAAHALSDDEGANAEAVATALRTVPSSADCGDGFVAFGAVS